MALYDRQKVVAMLQQVLPQPEQLRMTGIGVACVLQWEHAGYLAAGNRESGTQPVHAETQALASGESGDTLLAIHMASTIPGLAGIKQAIPCLDCTTSLMRWADDDTELILHDPANEYLLELGLLQMVAASYKTYLQPGRADTEEAQKALPIGTDYGDQALLLAFVAELDLLPNAKEVAIIGTASGRGGPRTLVNERVLGRPYADIDLIVIGSVSDADLEKVYNGALQRAGYSGQRHATHRDKHEVAVERLGSDPDPSPIGYPTRSYRTTQLWLPGTEQLVKPPYERRGTARLDVSRGDSLATVISPVYNHNNWYVLLK